MKRSVCFLLALLCLVSCVACASDQSEDNGDVSAVTTTAFSEGESDSDRVLDDLPELDFQNREFRILSRNRSGWTDDEITVKSANAEVVNDAIFNRQTHVEERLGIRMKNIQRNDVRPEDVIDEVKRVVKSGHTEYEVSASACFVTMAASLDGIYSNILHFDYIDLEKPYWAQGFNEASEYGGAQYAFTGAALLSMYRFAFVTLFNKNLFDKNNQEYLYTLVSNGEWTLDKQAELIPLFYKDLNGNQINDEEDQHGFTNSDQIGADPYWSACEVEIINKNTDGVFEMVLDIERLSDMADKVLYLYYGTDGSFVFKRQANDDEQVQMRKNFAQGKAAMTTLRMMEVESGDIRNMTDKYGIVPMPKFSVQQKNYRSLLHDQFTVFAVPNTVVVEDRPFVGAVLEALASESYKTVTPAYYETALKYKYMSDPESWKMLDLIYENIYIDPGIIYTSVLDSFHDAFRTMTVNNKNTVASTYAKKAKACQNKLNRTILKKLDKYKERE